MRSLALALNALLAEVRENVNAQKRFISDAAHQMRTPLAGLKSQTELALNSSAVSADPRIAFTLASTCTKAPPAAPTW